MKPAVAIAMAAMISVPACALRKVPPPPLPPVLSEDERFELAYTEGGYRPVPASCGSIAAPIATAEQALCVAVNHLGAEWNPAEGPYYYRAGLEGGEWWLVIGIARPVFGGGWIVVIDSESGAVKSIEGQR